MTNLLERAISTDDGDRAAKIIQMRLVSKATTWQTIASGKPDQSIASSARGSSVIG